MITLLKRIYGRIDKAYKRGYNKALFSCRHMSHLSSEAMDRELTFRETWTRRIHFMMCTWCRRYDKQLRFLQRNIRHYAQHFPERDASDPLSTERRERILKKIREEE